MAARVLIISVSLLHEGRDPRTIRAQRLISGLGERGITVELLSLWLGEGVAPEPEGVARTLAVRAPIDWEGAGAGEPENDEGLGDWVSGAVAAARELPEDERPDLVYALGVPVSALVAGEAVASAIGRPLVVDLGDPWLTPTPEQADLRGRVLGAAAAVVTTTPQMERRLRPALAPGAEILLAPAGGEIRARTSNTGPETSGPPRFLHLGTINAGRVDPVPSFEALARAHAEGRIEFRSHSTGWHPDFEQLPHPHLPLLPHADALDLLAGSAAALVLGNDNREQLPSKVFEIACTETWALCVSELADDATVELLRESGHAVVAAANTEEAVAASIDQILEREARGERPSPAERYSWRRRIDEIAALLSAVAAR